MRPAKWMVLAGLVASSVIAHADEICGNGLDDDSPPNGQTDEGCYTPMQKDVCESPLSCLDTGWVSWKTGSLHYDVPADVAPKSPFGPGIGFRRFYTSQYAPPAATVGTPAPVNRTPLGARWQHNYMSWIDAPSASVRVIHTPRGEDVAANKIDGVWILQPGRHFHAFRQSPTGGYELETLGGDTMIYNSVGLLVGVRDRVAAPYTHSVTITWTTTSAGSVVDSVIDATGLRKLRFGYTGATLTKIDYQLKDDPAAAEPWTTHHTTSYTYTSGVLWTVTIGGQLAQTNVYSNLYLTQIKDGENRQIVGFKYRSNKPGRIVSVDTTDGTIGFEYDALARCGSATNMTKTLLYFNKGNATSCSTDADCGAGLMCGGKTQDGPNGTCFRAARCLTVDLATSLVKNVDALGPPGEACTGACASVAEYLWNPNTLAVRQTPDPGAAPSHLSIAYNERGLPTTMVFGDNDAIPDNATNGRAVHFLYDAQSRLVEIRRPSAMLAVSTCSASNSGGCARTLFTYDPSSGEVASKTLMGWTLGADGPDSFVHVTTNTYDDHGRLAWVDGPVPGTDDASAYGYHDNLSDPKSYGFLSGTFDYVGGTPFPWLDRRVVSYDIWGNATDWTEPDGTHSCRIYFTNRNVLMKSVEKMDGGTCATEVPIDLVEEYAWDSNLRLTRVKNAGGSCTHHEYDAKGRLARSKRRDDCNVASPGPREEYVYDADGLLTAIDTYDAANVVTRKRLATYYDSRQLQGLLNPADPTKVTALTYGNNGVLKEITDAGNLGNTKLTTDGANLLTKIERASIANPWQLDRDLAANIKQVTDPDLKTIKTTYDDLGNLVERVVPDEGTRRIRYNENGDPIGVWFGTEPTAYVRDPSGRVTSVDYPGTCLSAPEITIVYDQVASCPAPEGCTNVRGRVAASRVTLMCNSTLADKALDRWTYYSYDAAGRVIGEYIVDDVTNTTYHVSNQTYTWTKSGDLATAKMPSTATIGWTYGSPASNADTDRVTAVWLGSSATPIIDDIAWKAYGPVEQYDRYDTINGSPLRMKYAYDLAYRTTQIRLDAQNGTGPYYSLGLGTDAKGRVTRRDVYPSDPQIAGVFDSFYLYDDADRLLCESKVAATSCPTVAAQLKNNLVGGLTGAGDRTTLLRPDAGGLTNTITRAANGHRITSIAQSTFGTTSYSYDQKGRRTIEDNLSLNSAPYPAKNLDRRTITYDARGNVSSVSGFDKLGRAYMMRNAFDTHDRRVFKAVEDIATGIQQQWLFFYDPYGRLTEVRFLANAYVPSQFKTYRLVWLEGLLVAYWETNGTSANPITRYVESDEMGRPVRMHAAENGTSVVKWAVDQDAWGFDKVVVGADVYQPIVFPGQYRDDETASYLADGTMFRPGLVHNGYRTYDPFTGTYLQIDPKVTETWEGYVYGGNNPVGLSDPQGLETIRLHGEACWPGDERVMCWRKALSEPPILFWPAGVRLPGGFVGDGSDGGPENEPSTPPKPKRELDKAWEVVTDAVDEIARKKAKDNGMSDETLDGIADLDWRQVLKELFLEPVMPMDKALDAHRRAQKR